MPNIGIVYDGQTGAVRQIIVPEKNRELRNVVLQPGEEIVAVDSLKFINGCPELSDAIAAVEEVRGIPAEKIETTVIESIQETGPIEQEPQW